MTSRARVATYRVRTYLAAAALIGAVVVATLDTAAPTGQPSAPTDPGPVASMPAPSTVAPTPMSSATPSIDYVSSEGTGRLTVTGARRSHGVTEVDVTLTASTGYQSYLLSAYDDHGTPYEAAPERTSPPRLISGTLAAGETVQGHVAFACPSGPLWLVLHNDRGEAVAALQIP